jgi:hypothetical protein
VAKFEEVARPPRILICGEPAAGKTGALAQLANAGYRLMIHDFDNNSRVIGSYLKPGAGEVYVNPYVVAKSTTANIFGDSSTATRDAHAAMLHFGQMLRHWKTPTEDLGPSADMTSKDVIVVDSGTFLGELLLLASNEDNEVKRDKRSLYNVAGNYYGAILDRLTGPKIGAAVILLTHIMQTGDKDEQGKIIGKSRDIPVGVGEKFSKKMQTYFSDIWHLEVGRDGKRSFKTAATDKASLRTSATNLIKPVEDFDLASMLDRLTGSK